MDINSAPLEEAGIADIQAALLTGRATAEQLVAEFLRRIDRFDRSGPALNAMVTLNPHAQQRAEQLDASLRATNRPVGPLHGVPMVIKDCLETTNMPTTFGSEIFADYWASVDATVVAKLHEAGAIILGKTTLPDWATSWFSYSSVSGTTRNPYELRRDPGGSSSGTGAAIAAGYATVGLGTDCGGSIRLPSSFCNLVGVRSTPGIISRKGCNPLVGAQDTIGPMARSVQDAARVFSVLAGYDPDDPLTYAYSVARAPRSYLTGLTPDALQDSRIGVLRSAFGSDDQAGTASVNQVITAALAELIAGGATLIDMTIDDLSGWISRTSMYTIRSRYDIDRFLETRPNAPMTSVEQIIRSGRYHKKLDLLEALAAGPADPRQDLSYHAAYEARAEFTQLVVNQMATHRLDALVYPTCQVPPPTHEETDSGVWNTLNFPTNTVIGSQTWMPAITVPAGLTDAGLPVGLEILARPYDEPTMFRIAYGFEQVTGHRVSPASTPPN